MTKLHLGCGRKQLPGYIHVDVIPYDHINFVADVSLLPMFKDNSVDEIYACHVLEHIKRFDIPATLDEWNRVLKPSGTLRIAVPDFEEIAKVYLETQDINKLIGLLYGGQNYDYNYHHMAFDYPSLAKILAQSNFTNIGRYNWKEFLPEGYDDYSRAYLPHMDFKKGRLMSLNMISTKV